MKKKVNYEGTDYIVTFERYGYFSSRFIINGEASSYCLDNEKLTDIKSFKDLATRSIKEYIHRHKAENEFKNWDGKL